MLAKKRKDIKTTSKLQNTLDRDVFNGSEEEEEVNKDLISYLDESKGSDLVPQNMRLKWSRFAFWASIFSGLVTLAFSLASFLVSRETSSSSIFANAFDALLGTVSSFAVAWRFRDEMNGGDISSKRERTATFGISLSFIATGIATVAASIVHLTETDHPRKTQEMLIILWCSLVAFLLLAYMQYCLASKLDSQSMWAAGADSVLAAAMSFGIGISTYIYREWPKGMWWLDHAVACCLGVISAMYGIYLLTLTVLCNQELLGEKSDVPEDKVPLK